MRKHGFATALAYGVTNDPDGQISADLAERGIPLFRLPHLVRPPAPISDLRTLGDIKRLLRTNPFDIVHTHSSKAGVLGRLAAASAGVPAVHTPHGHVFYGYFGKALTRLFVLIERWMAGRARRIVSLTDIETRECLDRKIGTPSQYVTIHSGVPLARFRNVDAETGVRFRRDLNVPPDHVLFVSVGRLVPVKGFDLLIRGFAASHSESGNVHLAIVGNGSEKALLEQMTRDAGIAEHVTFTGALDDVCGVLAAADAFVLASRNEGMGRAVIEAMAAGLPVIASAVGGIPAVVGDRRNGILVPPEDPHALAKAVAEMAASPDLREELGRNGAESVYPEYDEDTMIEQLATLYREVLGEAQS